MNDEAALHGERAEDAAAALPGASVPPAMAVLPTVPLPASVPPAFTVVSADVAVEPSTISVPPLTVVAPV